MMADDPEEECQIYTERPKCGGGFENYTKQNLAVILGI